MQDYVSELLAAVEEAERALLALGEAASARPLQPGKWSPREVIGHLVDSASNNHQRFVRASLEKDLVFGGYDQAAWVAAQGYAHAPWSDLVSLWAGYNRHIARVMQRIPQEIRLRLCARHNLDEIAWQTVPREVPTTLDYLMRDYVAHLRHHLRQVLGPQE